LTGDLRSVAVDPYGLSVYVANFTNSNVSAYDILVTARLTAWARVSHHRDRPRLGDRRSLRQVRLSGEQHHRDISAYTFSGTGLPVAAVGAARDVRARAGSISIAMTKGTAAVTYTPTYAYVANGDGGVSGYTISGTGALSSLGAAVASGTSPKSVAVHPSGQYVYVANSGTDNNLVMYTIDPANAL